MDMVERVARAILVSEIPEADFDYCKYVPDHPLYERSMRAARAAIEAMREPTTAQLAAGQKAWASDDLKRSSTLYRAMIDAALSHSGGE